MAKRLLMPDADGFAAFRELMSLLVQNVGYASHFRRALNEGFRPFVTEIDDGAAVGAGEFMVLLKPSESLLGLIAAIRAGDADFQEFIGRFGIVADHGSSSCVGAEIASPSA